MNCEKKNIEIAFREDLCSELGLKEGVQTRESIHFVAGLRETEKNLGLSESATLRQHTSHTSFSFCFLSAVSRTLL